ncbi:hypothetical protein PCL_04888, partial [Purpureocillium lilacinum]
MEANKQDGGSPGETSQMLMQMMSQMAEQLQALRAEREADREETRSQICALQSAIGTPAPTPQPASSAIERECQHNTSPQSIPTKKKPTIPDPKLFDGNRRNFRAWQLAMESKLRVDGPAIGGPAD